MRTFSFLLSAFIFLATVSGQVVPPVVDSTISSTTQWAPLSPPSIELTVVAEYSAWDFMIIVVCLPIMTILLFLLLVLQIVDRCHRPSLRPTFDVIKDEGVLGSMG